MTESEASYARKDQEKEEMIRQMKQKLEESPENISVPVAAAEVDHEKTKTELTNLREKCKKLIVKVKQQDAIIKKGGARPEPASSGGTEELAQVSRQLESLTKVNQELSAGHQNLAAENAALSQQTEALQEEQQRLLQKAEEDEAKAQSEAAKQQQRVEDLKNQLAQVISEQVELKDVVKSLSLAKRELEVKCEESQAEIKRIHERQLVSKMAASPLLDQQDPEDGWGSPEPESDGWGGWADQAEDTEDGLQAGDTAEDSSRPRTEREADIEDGWGDDTWGGFGEEAGAGGVGGGLEMLADNLR